MAIDFDELLGDGMNEDTGNETDKPQEGNQNLSEEFKKELEIMRKEAGDLKEKIRQLSEENKEYKDLKQRLFGNTELEETKARMLEDEQKFHEDPVAYMENRLKNFEDKIDSKEFKKRSDRAILELKKNYDIDIDKEYPKIVKELKNFTYEARMADPKGVLLKACRIAGVLKLKKKSEATTYTGEGYSRTGRGKKDPTAEELIRKRILGVQKKSNNFFGI